MFFVILCVNELYSLNKKPIRPLGAYETLLSRKIPSGKNVALSHGCAVVLSGSASTIKILDAIEICIAKHPLLRSYIDQDPSNGGCLSWFPCNEKPSSLAREVLQDTHIVPSSFFKEKWHSALENAVNDVSFPETGPQWKMEHIITEDYQKSAWVFCMNHGIDDQQSVNIVVQDILLFLSSDHDAVTPKTSLDFPASIEEAVSPEAPGLNTLIWGAFQLGNLLAGPVQLPFTVKARAGESYFRNPEGRTTVLRTFTLRQPEVAALRTACRSRKLTLTHALAAAMLYATSMAVTDAGSGPLPSMDVIKLRFLLSVGLRPFGQGEGSGSDFTGGTVACAGGAVDYIVPVDLSAITTPARDKAIHREGLWELAARSSEKAASIFNRKFVPESVRLFDFGMRYAEVLAIVDADAASATLGRGFSCGVSNVGVCDFPAYLPQSSEGVSVEGVYYGTSHARNGVLCQLSCETVKSTGSLCGCLQMTSPILSREDQAAFEDGFRAALMAMV